MSSQQEVVTDRPDISQAGNVTLVEAQQAAKPALWAPNVDLKESTRGGLDFELIKQIGDRWNMVSQFEFSEAQVVGTELLSLDVPSCLRQETYGDSAATALYSVFQYVQCDIALRFELSSTKFQSGQLQISQYYADSIDGNYKDRSNVYTRSQMSHVLLTVPSSVPAEIHIPFQDVCPFVRTHSETHFANKDFANVKVFVLNPLVAASGNSSKCSISVFARMENIVMKGMTPRKKHAKLLTGIKPEMLSILKDIAIGGAERLLGNLGENRDLPRDPLAPSRLVARLAEPLCLGRNSTALVDNLRLDNLAVCPIRATDEMSVSKIAGVPGLVAIHRWQVSDATGKAIATLQATPFQSTQTQRAKPGNLSTYAIPPVGILASCFAYWRGSLQVRVDVVASAFHAGRFSIAFYPARGGHIQQNEISGLNQMICDIKDARSFTFNVPFEFDREFAQAHTFRNGSMRETDGIGTIYLLVVNPLITAEGASDTVSMNIYLSGGSDFEVSVPRAPMIGLGWDTSIRLEPSDVVFRPGYANVYVGTWRYWQGPILRYGPTSDHIAQIVNGEFGVVYSMDPPLDIRAPDDTKMQYFACPVIKDDTARYLIPFSTREMAMAYIHSGQIETFGQGSKNAYVNCQRVKLEVAYRYVIEPESDDLVQNPDPTVPTMSSKVFGESFSDLKDLCRRAGPYYHGIIQLETDADYGRSVLNVPLTPMGLKVDPNKHAEFDSVTNYERNGVVPIIASGFRFFSGGIRLRILLEGPNIEDLAFAYTHIPDVHIGYEPTQEGNLGPLDNVVTGYAATVQSIRINQLAEIEIPNYNPGPQSYLQRHGNTGAANEQFAGLGYLSLSPIGKIRADVRVNIHIFMSLADDTHFRVFTGFPPMVKITEIPARPIPIARRSAHPIVIQELDHGRAQWILNGQSYVGSITGNYFTLNKDQDSTANLIRASNLHTKWADIMTAIHEKKRLDLYLSSGFYQRIPKGEIMPEAGFMPSCKLLLTSALDLLKSPLLYKMSACALTVGGIKYLVELVQAFMSGAAIAGAQTAHSFKPQCMRDASDVAAFLKDKVPIMEGVIDRVARISENINQATDDLTERADNLMGTMENAAENSNPMNWLTKAFKGLCDLMRFYVRSSLTTFFGVSTAMSYGFRFFASIFKIASQALVAVTMKLFHSLFGNKAKSEQASKDMNDAFSSFISIFSDWYRQRQEYAQSASAGADMIDNGDLCATFLSWVSAPLLEFMGIPPFHQLAKRLDPDKLYCGFRSKSQYDCFFDAWKTLHQADHPLLALIEEWKSKAPDLTFAAFIADRGSADMTVSGVEKISRSLDEAKEYMGLATTAEFRRYQALLKRAKYATQPWARPASIRMAAYKKNNMHLFKITEQHVDEWNDAMSKYPNHPDTGVSQATGISPEAGSQQMDKEDDCDDTTFGEEDLMSAMSILLGSISNFVGCKKSVFQPGALLKEFFIKSPKTAKDSHGFFLFFRSFWGFLRKVLIKILGTKMEGIDEDTFNEKKFSIWLDRSLKLVDPANRVMLESSPALIKEVYTLKAQGEIYLGISVSFSNLRATVLSVFNKLEKLNGELLNDCLANSARYVPFSVSLSGAPGVGKSYIVNELSEKMVRAIGWNGNGPVTYTRTLGNKYWNRLQNEPVVVYDDVMAFKGTVEQEQLAEILGLLSTQAFNPLVAEVEGKHKLYNPLLVFMTTNTPYPDSAQMREIRAFYRRRNVLYRFQLKPEYESMAKVPREVLLAKGHLQIARYEDPADPLSILGPLMSYEEFQSDLFDRHQAYHAIERLEYRRRVQGLVPREETPLAYDQIIERKLEHSSIGEFAKMAMAMVTPEILPESDWAKEVDKDAVEKLQAIRNKQRENRVSYRKRRGERRRLEEEQGAIPKGMRRDSKSDEESTTSTLIREMEEVEQPQSNALFLTGAPHTFCKGECDEIPQLRIEDELRHHVCPHTDIKDPEIWVAYKDHFRGNVIYDCSADAGRWVSASKCAINCEMDSWKKMPSGYDELIVLADSDSEDEEEMLYTVAQENPQVRSARAQVRKMMERMKNFFERPSVIRILKVISMAGLFVGAILAIYKALFAKKERGVDHDDDLEACRHETFDDHLGPKKQIHRSNAVRIDVKKFRFAQPETTFVSPREVLGRLVSDNSFELSYQSKAGKGSTRAVGICGRHGVTVKHFFEKWRYFGEPTLILTRKGGEVKIHPKSISVVEFPESSLCSVTLPKQSPLFRDIRKHIATVDIHSSIGSDGVLMSQYGESRVDAELRFHFSNAISIDGEEGVAPQRIMSAYTYKKHGKGLCGSVLVADSSCPQIVGIHIAGSSATSVGYAQVVAREMFAEFSAVDIVPPDFSDDFSRARIDPEAGLIPLGVVPNTLEMGLPSTTRLTGLPTRGIFHEELKQPAILTPKDPRNKTGWSPLQCGVRKHGIQPIGMPPDLILEAGRAVENKLIAECKPPLAARVELLTMQQIACGIAGRKCYSPLNMSTSEGFPLIKLRPKGEKSKAWLFNINRAVEPNQLISIEPELDEQLKFNEQLRRQGKAPMSVFGCALKDALILKEKVAKEGKTRVFLESPVELTIATKRYFGHFFAALYENRIRNELCIGMNPQGPEWAQLVRHLGQVSTGDTMQVITGDYSHFGDSLEANVVHEVFRIALAWYQFYFGAQPGFDENQAVRKVLIEEILCAPRLARNFLYQTYGGIASGFVGTAEVNSLVNALYMRIAWMSITGKGLRDFERYVRFAFYGDDCIGSVHEKYQETFNFSAIKKFFADYNIAFTDEMKTGFEYSTLPLTASRFLKRAFTRHPKRPGEFLAPLNDDSIFPQLDYSWKTNDLEAVALDNCRAALQASHARGQKFYDHLRNEMIAYWQEQNIRFDSDEWCRLDDKIFTEE